MTVPLSLLRSRPPPGLPSTQSLGDVLNGHLNNSNIHNLLDCLCTTSEPAIFSPEKSQEPLRHASLRSFIETFTLPCPARHQPLGPNDRVAVVLPTGPENAVALLATTAYHTCAPFNSSCTASELREDATRLNVKAIVTTRDFVERLELNALRKELGCDVILVDKTMGRAGLFTMSLFGEQASHHSTRSIPNGLDGRALILHTSGTSGKKKPVPYTLRSLIVGTCAVVDSWDLQSFDINLNMMPLFHVGGIVRNLLAPLFSGGSTIVCGGFDPIAFWTIAADFGATWYYAAPTIHHAILSSQPADIHVADHIRIRMICNAAGGLLPSLALQLKDRFTSAVVLPSYGMTECMPIASPPTTYNLDRPGCSGIACGPHLSIRDPSNLEHEVERGTIGAVSVRGLPTFGGYEVSPDLSVPLDTSAFTSGGWFDSGDVGYMDDDGYLFITGRSKEIINKGGEVISPFEVEEAIVTAAGGKVKAALAFSVEHDILQETVAVVVVPMPGQPRIGLSQLQDALKDSLHPSKWPFAIVYMPDIPKNSAGKPLRVKLGHRLGIGRLSDTVPLLHRHFEADTPDSQASLSDSIPCRKVEIDVSSIQNSLKHINGVEDTVVRLGASGKPEAFVHLSPGAIQGLGQEALIWEALARELPGYSLPDIRIMEKGLLRSSSGSVDFDAMDKSMYRRQSSQMSLQARTIRDIVANLLNISPSIISLDSDFFLLGGTSLLLGRLSYEIRKQMGVSITVSTLFTNSTISRISALVGRMQRESMPESSTPYSASQFSLSSTTLCIPKPSGDSLPSPGRRGQTHPFVLTIQIIPLIFFYQLKAALSWTFFLYFLVLLVPFVSGGFIQRVLGLICALLASRIAVRTVAPCLAILFKWIVIGRYKPGVYPMWSNYYLRWWIVNQALLLAGRGIFVAHPSFLTTYYRLLGARIGRNVKIDPRAQLGELDLLTIHDNCCIDKSLVRGFCVEREGYFRLAPIELGEGAVINTYTQISPGSTISQRTVYGPHSSSSEAPSPRRYAAYNTQSMPQPHWALQLFVAWPIILLVNLVAHIPWMVILYLMFEITAVEQGGLNDLQAVVFWFAEPQRVALHFLSRAVRVVISPILQVVLGIIIKRMLGLSKPTSHGSPPSQFILLRRFINSHNLSAKHLHNCFSLLGTHYEVVSVVYRLMGAKVGRQVYWPGSGIWCQDPELLEIGDNVVFGSRSEIFTTDGLGSMKVRIGNGAMIADRVVLLPGTVVGSKAVLGSGTLTSRETSYPSGSTWIGSDRGNAICLQRGTDLEKEEATSTPFGRAFYEGKAPYFVFPYALILSISVTFSTFCALYWAVPAVGAIQILKALYLAFPSLNLLRTTWWEVGVVYGITAICYLVVVNIQVVLAICWVIATKWVVIGRREAGSYDWDKSDYNQRWQLHLIFMKLMSSFGPHGGVLTSMTGSAYIVWFYRSLGANIGKNCSIYTGGYLGLMTEPDLVELGNDVSLDNCSVVAHINSRGNFSLNKLSIGQGCALRSGSRLLSGASMEEYSMLCEHTLLTSGEVADAGGVYVGWPGSRRLH